MLNEKASLKSTAKAALYLLPMLVITITFNIWPIINSFLMSSVCHQYCGDCDGLELDVPQ